MLNKSTTWLLFAAWNKFIEIHGGCSKNCCFLLRLSVHSEPSAFSFDDFLFITINIYPGKVSSNSFLSILKLLYTPIFFRLLYSCFWERSFSGLKDLSSPLNFTKHVNFLIITYDYIFKTSLSKCFCSTNMLNFLVSLKKKMPQLSPYFAIPSQLIITLLSFSFVYSSCFCTFAIWPLLYSFSFPPSFESKRS